MIFSRHNPEWTRREIAARAGIGFAGGVIGAWLSDVLREPRMGRASSSPCLNVWTAWGVIDMGLVYD